MAAKTLILLTAILGMALCYPEFQNNIPNGDSVTNPCTQQNWLGVGHQSVYGSGTLNKFGDAFKANDFKWTAALCNADSDGDGVSNGAELGDPNCSWVKDGANPEGSATGHPGICEPVDDPKCAKLNDWLYDC